MQMIIDQFYSMINTVGGFTLLEGFQPPATPVMEGIVDLHNHIFFFLIVVAVFVFYFFYAIISEFVVPYQDHDVPESLYSEDHVLEAEEERIPEINRFFNDYEFQEFYTHSFSIDFVVEDSGLAYYKGIMYHTLFYRVTHLPVLEIIWTLIPTVILLFIAVPSFALLYAMDEVIDPRVTVKAIGHQWYWSYEYSDAAHDPKKFDSYMIAESALTLGSPRLLSVDNSVVLPAQTHIRVLVTSDDVLHSWAVPALGLKVDAVPGRLSQLALFMRREGVFYGQCSELCGVNHAFMPISVKSVNLSEYASWLKTGSGYSEFSQEVKNLSS